MSTGPTVRRLLGITLGAVAALAGPPAEACIWDSDSLADERSARPTMAKAILDDGPPAVDVARLRARIAELRRQPREADPAWWNDLAGAHIRLGEPAQAVSLLAPIAAERFPGDYGVHANLGTAYHLLGRYGDAERGIARDLEINAEGHFGLERYHLALLQYLARDAAYQARHLYVDEWSIAFMAFGNMYLRPIRSDDENVRQALADDEPALRERRSILEAIVKDPLPGYRAKWDLAADAKFEEGVLYMGSLNRTQPAAVVMLGVASLKNRDLNLAAAAFRRAIRMGSAQTPQLEHLAAALEKHVAQAANYRTPRMIQRAVPFAAGAAILAAVLLYLRSRRARRRSPG